MRYFWVIYYNGIVGIFENKVGFQWGFGVFEGYAVFLGDFIFKVIEFFKVICFIQIYFYQSVKVNIFFVYLRIKVNR